MAEIEEVNGYRSAVKYVAIILALSLIAKDTVNFGQPYLLRVVGEGLCLIVGIKLLLSISKVYNILKYWLILAYTVTILISSFMSTSPMLVALQAVSLGAIFIYFIGYYEQANIRSHNDQYYRAVIIAYVLVCFGSLILLKINPNSVYEVTSMGHKRFSGLYSEPGMMANAAGLLVGLAFFRMRMNYEYRWFNLIAVILGLTCLALSLSRTNWLAAFAAGGIVYWLYLKKWRTILISLAVLIVYASAVLYTFNLRIDPGQIEKIVRAESLETLSGRTTLWKVAFNSFQSSPILGYGFTRGTDSLRDTTSASSSTYIAEITRNSRTGTFHNGYIQSLLDVGIVGAFFYTAIILGAIYRMVFYDTTRQFPTEAYILLYGAIANIGKTFAYSASVFDSVLFWSAVVFAYSLRKPLKSRFLKRAHRNIKYA